MEPTTHTLTVGPNETFRDRPEFWSALETLRIGYRCYSVGGWTANAKHRLIMQGPLVAGPAVYAFGHATVITAHRETETRTFVPANLGDLVTIGECTYRLDPANNQNIALTQLSGPTPGCGIPCSCHTGTLGHRNTDTGVWEPCGCEG